MAGFRFWRRSNGFRNGNGDDLLVSKLRISEDDLNLIKRAIENNIKRLNYHINSPKHTSPITKQLAIEKKQKLEDLHYRIRTGQSE